MKKLLGLAVIAAVAFVVSQTWEDVQRYLKIRNM